MIVAIRATIEVIDYAILPMMATTIATIARGKDEVEKAMHEFNDGKLKSGKSGKKVSNPKQAIAIGLSKARKKGGKVPAKKS